MSENDNVVSQQQTQQSGRRGGRRGGRGRGQGGRGVSTYINDNMSRYINSFSMMANPVINYYIVDVASALLMFFAFEGFIRTQPTRTAWAAQGYYTGLMLYCLASRLQRIGMKYHQCAFEATEMIYVDMVELPTSIATIIEQFGYVEDEQGFTLIPKVTNDLILLLHRVGYDLMLGGGNRNTLIVGANIDYMSFMSEGYSAAHASTYGLCIIASQLGYPAPVTGIAAVDRNNLHSYLVSRTMNEFGGANITQVQLNVLNPIPAAPVPAADAYLIRGGAVPAVGAPFTAQFVAAVAAARLYFGLGLGAAPFPNPWGSNALANDVLIPFNDLTYIAEVTKLKVVFTCRKLNQDTTGTKAPLVTVNNTGVAKPTALMYGTTAQEFYFGCALNSLVVTITPTERFYNVENPSRRQFRYMGAPVNTPVSGVRGALIQSDVIVRK